MVGCFQWPTLLEKLPLSTIVLLIAGGISYSFGTIFFVWDSLPYNHSIWHVFVLEQRLSLLLHSYAPLKISLYSSFFVFSCRFPSSM